MKTVEVRQSLIDALRLDLIGPGEALGNEHRVLGQADELLSQRPSTWYLSGFLVPFDADPDQKTDKQSDDEMDAGGDAGGTDDAVAPEPAAARVRYLPSSMGASLLVRPDVTRLKIIVRWGDYRARKARDSEPGPFVWHRTGHEEGVPIELPAQTDQPVEQVVPHSNGLSVAVSVRPVLTDHVEGGLPVVRNQVLHQFVSASAEP